MRASFIPSGPCWICGTEAFSPVHRNRFDLSPYDSQDPELAAYTGCSVSMERCATCGFMQPSELPALQRYFERLYDQRWSRDWVVSEFESAAKRRIFEDVLRELDGRVTTRPRRLLDIGAHVGQFVAMAAEHGWHAEALELNPTTAAYARERTGLRVHETPLGVVARAGAPFDAVTLIDVLEHIPHPVDTLREAAAALKPGGWLALKVPSGSNQLLKERLRTILRLADRVSIADNLVHVSLFSPRSLRVALTRAGFDRVWIGVGMPEACATGTWLRRLAGNAARRALYGVASTVPAGVYLPIAFNLQAFARRAGAGR